MDSLWDIFPESPVNQTVHQTKILFFDDPCEQCSVHPGWLVV